MPTVTRAAQSCDRKGLSPRGLRDPAAAQQPRTAAGFSGIAAGCTWRSPFRRIPRIKLFVNQNHALAPARGSQRQPGIPPLKVRENSSHFLRTAFKTRGQSSSKSGTSSSPVTPGRSGGSSPGKPGFWGKLPVYSSSVTKNLLDVHFGFPTEAMLLDPLRLSQGSITGVPLL